ncbi:YisL family protein [Cytobacillus gottheilii]|uniref:UPF0344 protein J1899_07245 n=1 Tax=Cytobacillus gottheilii TaxID=859144 RepID=A0ABX8FFQ2_9BACI|nr:YisL family protein [Cytobacillus gottheilii]QVY62836.1 YisL family protein [Cytobacillus gottheilii]
MTHAHITTWVVALILFFVVLSLQKSGKAKGAKIVHMVLRLFYLLIIGTGIWMLTSISNIDMMYILKSLIGIWVIAAVEMVLVRTAKGKKTGILWAQLGISLVLVIYLGLKLPLGFTPFM